MNFQVAVFFIGSQFQKLKEQSSCYGDGGNKKVFCLICTCMGRNSGLVAHAVSFCSTVFVLALKNNDLSRLLHHASWINDNKIQTYSGSERIKTPLPSLSNWHFSPSFPLSADAAAEPLFSLSSLCFKRALKCHFAPWICEGQSDRLAA